VFFPVRIARRYLFSRRLPGAINLITLISVLGIGLGTAALIVALSVFNGFHELLRGLFEDFDPDIRITRSVGKYLDNRPETLRLIRTTPGVSHVVPVLEGRAALKYPGEEAEHIVQLKGVPDDFQRVSRVEKRVVRGQYRLRDAAGRYGFVAGQGVEYFTRMNLMSETPMQFYTLSENADLLRNPEDALRSIQAVPMGAFSLQKEYDDNLVLVPLALARELLDQPEVITAYELKLDNPDAAAEVQVRLQAQLGSGYVVQTWYQQHQTLYEVMRNEKKVAFLVIAFMLLLASCNIVGSLTMVVLEKRRDIGILRTMGATAAQIRNIFLLEGLLVGGVAAAWGTAFGLGFCWLQATFGLLRLGGGDVFIVDAYPVEVQALDVVLVVATVIVLAILGSVYPAWRASRLTVLESIRG
jgi:lipoprotein-releasing system permease protein